MAGSTSHKRNVTNCAPCIRSLQLFGKCPRISLRVHIRFACISYAGYSRRFAGGSREASWCLRVHDMRDGVLCVTGALGASFDDVCFSSVVRLDEIPNSIFTAGYVTNQNLRVTYSVTVNPLWSSAMSWMLAQATSHTPDPAGRAAERSRRFSRNAASAAAAPSP